MDSSTGDNQSNFPKASREELEEALKWLEELAARAEEQASPSNESEVSSLPESPFFGMLDAGEDDLPDWLKEITLTPETSGEGEVESRLDWLAKMAKRESIEELPTLEWRRFTSPFHEEQPPETQEEFASETGDIPLQSSTDAPPEDLPEPPRELDVDNTAQIDEAELPSMSDDFGIEELTPESNYDDLDAAMAWIEELAASQEAPIEDLPSVADRALASKLMLGVGLTDDSFDAIVLPEDLAQLDEMDSEPTFAPDEEDPADTIVLVETMAAESGRPIKDNFLPEREVQDNAGIEEISNPTEGDISDIVNHIAEPSPDSEPVTEDTPTEMEFEEPASISFEEAIAYLEELAIVHTISVSTAEESEDIALPGPEDVETEWEQTVVNEAPDVMDESIQEEESEFISQVDYDEKDMKALALVESDIESGRLADSEIASPEIESESFEPFAALIGTFAIEETHKGQANGAVVHSLEVTLLTLDALALPQGTSLDEIDARIRLGHTPIMMSDESGRDLPSILDWLEEIALEDEPGTDNNFGEMADEDIIQMMPEDPDEALAWLIRMASEEGEPATLDQTDVAISRPYSPATTEPPVATPVDLNMPDEGMNIADLMSMPEDPDEAMSWLESLAESEQPSQTNVTQSASEVGIPIEIEKPQSPNVMSAPKAAVKVARPRRPARNATIGTGWVDLLKPLE
jgi:uncharacterized protein Smg (DUF494 family)